MSAEAIRALIVGIPRRLWSSKPLVMLQAYVDDSIASTGDRKLLLAAYVLTADQWIEFYDAWDAALHEPPAIDYFKMAEANGRGGCFRKFSEAQRNKKVFRMAQVVKQFAPHGLHVKVSTKEFNELLKPYVPWPVKTPYYILSHSMIYGLARLHDQMGLKMKCDVIFDDHPGLAAKILPAFDLYGLGPESWRQWISGPPSFKDDKEVLPLQAADLLAWHLRRDVEGVEAPDYKGILDLLILDGVHHVIDVDRSVLEHLGQQFRDHPTMHMVLDRKDWTAAEQTALSIMQEAERQGSPFETVAEAEEFSIRLAFALKRKEEGNA